MLASVTESSGIEPVVGDAVYVVLSRPTNYRSARSPLFRVLATVRHINRIGTRTTYSVTLFRDGPSASGWYKGDTYRASEDEVYLL